MKVKYHPLTLLELQEATIFYENQSKGLGIEFTKEINASINRIKQFPEGFATTFKNCRRCITNRFPYGIIYKLGKNLITIYAIMHLNRDPKYWLKRIRGSI